MTPDLVQVTPLRACIIEAARAGNPPRVIAEELGTSRNCVKSILSQERAKGVEIPRFAWTGKPARRQAA